MPDQKIEIELELQDKASATIQQIAASVSEVIKHVGEMGKATTGTDSGVTRTVRSVQQLGDKTKETTRSLASMAAMLAPLAGAAGVVAAIGVGLVAAGNAVNEFAGSRLKLRNLSIDLGLSVDEMSIMSKTFEKMGMSLQEGESRLVEIGTTLKELQTYGEGSHLFRDLSQMGFDQQARELLATARSEGNFKAFLQLQDQYKAIEAYDKKAAANFLEAAKGFTESIGKDFGEASKGVTPEFNPGTENAIAFRKVWEDNKTLINNFIESMKEALVTGAVSPEPWWWDKYKVFEKKPPTDPNATRSLGGTKNKGGKTPEEEKKEGNSTLEKIRDSIKQLFGTPALPNSSHSLGKEFGGPVEQGQPYLVGERGPELYMGGGDFRIVGMSGPEVIQPPSAGTIFANAGDAWRAIIERSPVFSGDPPTSGAAGHRFGGTIEKAAVGGPYAQFAAIQDAMTQPPSGPDWPMAPMFEDARRQLDINLNAEMGGPSLSVSSEMVFRNVPPGVATKMDGEGFDNFKVSKSRALV